MYRLWVEVSIPLPTWDAIQNKPFSTLGSRLEVDENGVLSVDTTDNAEQGNTKPITSAGVNLVVGNINALLAII